MEQVAVSRRIAYLVLRQIDEQSYADSRELVRSTAKSFKAEEADTRLALTIVMGCLRYRLALNGIIKNCLERPNKALLPFVETILQMVAYQHYYLDRLPPYAICNDAVELVTFEGFGTDNRLKGFVNAVAKKIVSGKQMPLLHDLTEELSFPTWMIGLFKSRFGETLMTDILRECNCEPPVTLRVNRLKISRNDMQQLLIQNSISCRVGNHTPDSLILDNSGDLAKIVALSEFRDGYVYFQDEASQMVSVIANPHAGERVLDMCAAPGGKTTHLAEVADGKADIVASDFNESRLSVLRENVERMGASCVRVVPWDVLMAEKKPVFDLVLVDAPCSGLGTLRRNPEIKWRIEYKDLLRLRETQYALLCGAAKYVRDNGRLVYSTCSITAQENIEVIKTFLEKHSEWTIAKNGEFCSWPEAIDMDGFSIFVLTRKAY